MSEKNDNIDKYIDKKFKNKTRKPVKLKVDDNVSPVNIIVNTNQTTHDEINNDVKQDTGAIDLSTVVDEKNKVDNEIKKEVSNETKDIVHNIDKHEEKINEPNVEKKVEINHKLEKENYEKEKEKTIKTENSFIVDNYYNSDEIMSSDDPNMDEFYEDESVVGVSGGIDPYYDTNEIQQQEQQYEEQQYEEEQGDQQQYYQDDNMSEVSDEPGYIQASKGDYERNALEQDIESIDSSNVNYFKKEKKNLNVPKIENNYDSDSTISNAGMDPLSDASSDSTEIIIKPKYRKRKIIEVPIYRDQKKTVKLKNDYFFNQPYQRIIRSNNPLQDTPFSGQRSQAMRYLPKNPVVSSNNSGKNGQPLKLKDLIDPL